MVCARICPTEAAFGEKKELHTIDQEKYIKCGACFESCKFDAVKVS
jgi:Fe-S-cluster-containing hydrogenase component 2